MLLLPQDCYRIKRTKRKGRGVFAQKEIMAGTVIGDYLGRLLKEEAVVKLEKKYNDDCYSMDYAGNDLSIFPLDIKAVGVHLTNHSCSPNCDTYYYFGHTLFFALRRIFPGEELTIDYGFDPEEKYGRLFACFCGSPICRGTMYTSDLKLKRYGAFCRQQTKGQKFKLLQAGDILAPLEKYPKAIKDFNIFDLFASWEAKPWLCPDKKMPSIAAIRKRLRLSGRALHFSHFGLTVWGVSGRKLLAWK